MNDRIVKPEMPIFDPEQMRRTLRESEQRLLSVVNSAPMVLWAVDAHGIFTFSEGKGLESLGFRPNELVGRSIYDVYSGQTETLEAFERALRGEEFTSFAESRGILFDVRYSAVRDEDNGAVTGVIGVAVDITENRRAERERERAVSLLRASLESTADGILVVDGEGRIATYNTKFADMWQIPREVLAAGEDETAINHVLSQLRDPAAFVAKVRDLYADPEAASFDVLEFTDGRTFERYSQPQRVGEETVGRVWSFRDVTERRRAEEALRKRERQLEHTQRLTGLGSWEWDVAANTVTWSDELYRIYGLRPGSEAIDFESYLSRVHPDDRPIVGATIRQTLDAGATFDFIERIVRTDGTERVLHSQGEVIRDAAGEAVRLIGACHDVTDQTAAEKALRDAEASYRAIFELSNDAILVLDIDTGSVIDANVLGEELQVIGGFGSLAGAEQLELAAAGEPQLFERRFDSDSGERCFEVSLRRVAINGHDRLLATARDITERKRAEVVLARSHAELQLLVNERTSELARTNAALQDEVAEREAAQQELSRRTAELEAIFHALPDLYFRLEPDGRIVANRSGRDSSLNLPEDAYVGQRIHDLIPEENRSELQAALDTVL
ncbi:MAG: PAS domain S-box protein, partial [Gemmatimonadota bacterium]